MRSKKIKNPLIKRIPKELLGEWQKYLVVALFLILTIGFVSGMYVANNSMLTSADRGITKYKLEDGHFELKEAADDALLSAIETGDKADIKQFYIDKAKSELDEKFDTEFNEKFAEQVEQSLLAQGLDEATVSSMLDAAIEQAKQDSSYGETYQKAYDEAWDKIEEEINEEYAKAEEKYELNDADFEAVPVKVYANFFQNATEDNNNDGESDGTIRVYAQTDDINLACLMEGAFPQNDSEIAIDRMHADNAGIEVGDTITVGGQTYTVVGLIAYVNYSTLHEKTTDLMFDAIKFDVAMVTEDGFDRLSETIHYAYAWKYVSNPATESDEKHLSDDFMKALLTQTVAAENEIEDYTPRYANPAVQFATEDMGSDEAMGGVLLDILIVIIAFIFAITISNTIVREASTIGTLRASGYTKGELIRHYISMPVIVTLVSACVGNILGYTVFKEVVVGMYYNSYSLPTFETIWTPDAFVKTTIVPVVLMFVVNLFVIVRMMNHSPLQFLHHDLKKNKRKKAMRLPKWSFIRRFRLRIMMQNITSYVVLFIGIFFIMVMLAMAVGMPDTLDYYQENVADMMFADYQYVLTSYEDEDGDVLRTSNEEAEAFCMTSLLKKSDTLDEEVSVYGISHDSDYVQISDLDTLGENEVYLSASFLDKYGLSVGDSVTLNEKYENQTYELKIVGVYEKCQSIAVFMPIETFRSLFELDEDEFSGYLSNSEITDIDKDYIATVITEHDITKMSDQLNLSMGAYMTYFQILCILLSAVLIYLLTKIIIEKNETAISMTKLLGYNNREIAQLYLMSTTIVVVVSDIISVFLGTLVMNFAWRAIMMSYSGWFSFVIQPIGYVKMFVFVLIGYLIVMVFDFRRIKKVPMDRALKNVE